MTGAARWMRRGGAARRRRRRGGQRGLRRGHAQEARVRAARAVRHRGDIRGRSATRLRRIYETYDGKLILNIDQDKDLFFIFDTIDLSFNIFN